MSFSFALDLLLPAMAAGDYSFPGAWEASGVSGLAAAVALAVALTIGVLLLIWLVWLGMTRKRSLLRQNNMLKEAQERRRSAEQALEASWEMLERIVAVHTEGIVVVDEDGDVIFANPAAGRLLGRKPQELGGLPIGILAGGDVCELDLTGKAGRIVEVRSLPLEWSERPAEMLCLRDVSESRQAVRDLARSEALLQSTMNSMQDLLVVIDAEHRVLLSNWRGLEDLSEEERLARPNCYRILRGRDAPCPDCHIPRVLETGESYTFEHMDPRNGRLVAITASPILDESGKANKVVEHLRDVTEERRTQRELAASEQVYRLLTQNIPNGAVHMFDHNLDYVISDGAIFEELGIDGESLKGKNLYEVLPTSEARKLEPCFHDALKGRKCSTEIRFMDRDFEVRTIPMENSDGEIIAGMVLSQDITQRKKAEAELRASMRRFRAVFENAAVGICTLATDGSILSANQVYCDLVGYSVDEVEQLSNFDVTAENDRENYREVFAELVSNREGQVFIEKDNLRKDGSLVPVRAGLSYVRSEEGEEEYVVAMMEDISARRDSERELAAHRQLLEERVAERTRELRRALLRVKDSRDKVDVILRSIGEGLMVTDNDSRIVLMNSQAEEILGISFAESVGRRVDLAIQDFSYREKLCRSIGAAQTRTQYQFDFEIGGSEGEERIIRAHTSTIFDRHGMQKGVVIIMSDVTRERQIDRMKTEFISTAAHELRTPLTSIQGYTELIATREGLDMATVRRFAEIANRMAVQLADIVSDLLDISRIESGKGFSFSWEMASINQLIRDKVEVYLQGDGSHNFVTDLCPEDDTWAWVDAGRTEQVLENILSNAVKYAPDGGDIVVSTSVDDDMLVVAVKDQGMGMDSYQVKHVFDKFFRGNAQGGRIQGTGLGMSIVRYIVEAQKGRIWIESEPGEGTTVSFSLPKSAPETGRGRKNNEDALMSPQGAAHDQTHTHS